ncbi:transposase [Melaminivora jejuensis]|uniref:transposase n=1 Tax=Melaminivora jejuensis TaxID=1267217 RepID=UPI00398AE393
MKRKKYASDISPEQFAEIEPLLRSVRKATKPTTVDLYEVLCAVLYLLRTGCQWRFLPPSFPNGRRSMPTGASGASPTSTE